MTKTFRKQTELKRIEMQKQIDSLQLSCKDKNSTIEDLRKVVSDVKSEIRKNIPEQAKKKIKCLKNEIKALNKRLDVLVATDEGERK